VSERQVDQETVAIVQPAKDECRNKGMEEGPMYVATNASQLMQGGKAASLLHICLHRQILIDENAEIRTVADSETTLEPIRGPEVGSQCWLRGEVSHMNSVLSEFSWSRLANIQSATTIRHLVTFCSRAPTSDRPHAP